MPDTPDQVPATDVRAFARAMFHADATPAPATVDHRSGAHVPAKGGNPRPPDDPRRRFVRELFGRDQ